MLRNHSIGSVLVVLCSTCTSWAAVVTFMDAEAFRTAAGSIQEITFDTRPDGNQLTTPVAITPSFNFTDQGVTFTSTLPILQRMGSLGGELYVSQPLFGEGATRIVAHFVTPVTAVGLIAPPLTRLSVYDTSQQFLQSFRSGAGSSFVGIISTAPIQTAVMDTSGLTFSVESFQFAPVPEPATLALLALGAVALFGHRRRRMG